MARTILLSWAGLGLALANSAAAAPACVANASNISFGTVGVASLVGATSTGTIYEGCAGQRRGRGQLDVCNAIGAGANSASQTQRTMTNGVNKIGYNLYIDPAYSKPYAYPGSDTFTIPYSPTGGGYTTTTTYAKILSGANVVPGTYTDTYTSSAQSYVDFEVGFGFGFGFGFGRNNGIPCGPNRRATGVTPNFTVSVTVPASCSISAGALSFGSVGLLTSNVDAAAALTVTCTNTTPYSVALGAGSGAGATVANRLMTGPSGATLGYGLYQDAARSLPWGATPPPAAGANTVSGVGTGSAQTLTVYGRVPPQKAPPPGAYADTVLVTLTY